MSKAKIEAEKLRVEAKAILTNLIGEDKSDNIDRLIDCIVGAAVLDVAALQEEAMSRNPLRAASYNLAGGD